MENETSKYSLNYARGVLLRVRMRGLSLPKQQYITFIENLCGISHYHETDSNTVNL